jgi:N-methylhydantoinase A
MLQVGPRSAGADPGPACYSKGGKDATVTDANLVLGRLIHDVAFADNMKLDKQLAVSAIEKLANKIGLPIEETALGIVRIATEHMAGAIRMISVNRGYDPKEFLLASFGGAGGLHVCSVAEAMQMSRAIVPVYSGVFSALGMLVADQGRQFTRTVSAALKKLQPENLENQFEKLVRHGKEQLVGEHLLVENLVVKRSVDMRYIGQSYTLNVPWDDLRNTEEAFKTLHRTRYGYALQADTEIVNLRVKVVHHGPQVTFPEIAAEPDSYGEKSTESYGENELPRVLARNEISANQEIQGPAIITEYSSTTFVEAGWAACSDGYGNLLLSKLN